MTPNAAAKRMLPYIGVQTLDLTANLNDPSKRQLFGGDVDFCAGCMTGALEEIFTDGPAALSEKRQTAVLHRPTATTVGVSQFSTTISAMTGWQDWMVGCTARVDGDSQDNEFVSETELLNPYMGTGGPTVPCTAFGDAVMAPEGTDSIIDPVTIPLWRPLIGVTSREQFISFNLPTGYMGGISRPGVSYYVAMNKSVGWPIIWFAECAFDPSKEYLPLLLRVNPMPQQDFSITFRTKIAPPIITAANIWDGNASDPAPDFNIPTNWHESIFLAYAMQRFTAHPSFTNDAAKKEIGRQYQVAQRKLQSYAASGAATVGVYAP